MAKSRLRDYLGEYPAIQALTIEGYKSLDAERRIELRPLTILAGANSAGKSSALQPLLLLKQTLEAAYDPGPLLLNGPNVKFTSVSQVLSNPRKGGAEGAFSFGISLYPDRSCRLRFCKGATSPVELRGITLDANERREEHEPGEKPFSESPLRNKAIVKDFAKLLEPRKQEVVVRLVRNRCFLEAVLGLDGKSGMLAELPIPLGLDVFEDVITLVIHVPGLRGNPRRNYPRTAVGDRFPGPFEEYVASVIAAAQDARDDAFREQLGSDLRDLGLTWKVQAQAVEDTQVELRVGRLPKPARGGAHDLVSIADVGFGVSQTLPVVVALLTAKPGQLVYIEQPEIHLHPRAQVAMASLLARAAQRGVRVVIETHSSLLLLGVQQLVAEEQLDPKLVKLHWFQRDETGATQVTSAELDEAGAFGDWPEDFDDVTLDAQKRYLDAAEKSSPMSHKKVPSVCFVIDASIARAAGPKGSEHPVGALCREFLEKVRGVCHRIAWNAALKAEWDKHESRFATAWRVSMVNLGKVRIVPDHPREELRESIRQHSADENVVAAMLKDAHLIEAALAADSRVAALDETVRKHFRAMCATCADLQEIFWVNPVAEGEPCIEWLESGAGEDEARLLRRPPAE